MGFMSLVAVYVPTEVCGADEEELFYAKFDSFLDQCPRRGTLIVLGDFTMFSLELRELATSCVLFSMALVPGTSTALSFRILQNSEG